MKTKTKKAADYGITLTGSKLKDFNRKYKEAMYKEENRRSKVLTLLGAFSMAGISIWLLAANVSSPATMLLMMIPPVIGIAVSVISLFAKDCAIRTQLGTSAALAMFLVLLLTVCYVADSDAVTRIVNDRPVVVGGKEYLPLYVSGMATTLLSMVCGIFGWSRQRMKQLAKDSQTGKQKPNYPLFAAIALLTSSIVRRLIIPSVGAGVLFFMVVLFMVLICAILGYVMGISVGNVRYLRYLGNSSQEN
ncbi:MAG: hypothetical protein E7559_04680 [Ruminococcaceae bacterium]|nr:hypothetical protein [Oscillospiraceae bacterium]